MRHHAKVRILPFMTMVGGGLGGVLDLVGARAASAAEERRLDDEVVAAIADTGLTRALLPVELGGTAGDPRAVVEHIARLGAVDGSVAWCTSINTGTKHFAGYLPEAAARPVFADVDAGAASMFAPAGVVTVGRDGRASLTGRWPFVSNCVHSRWIGVGSFVEDEGGERQPVPRLVFVPREDLVIEDTWFGAGLCATGSNHVRADAVPVDLARSCTFADRPWPDGPLWRIPLFTVLAPTLVASLLGIARGAVDHLQERVRSGGGGAARGALADDPVGLADLGAADTALRVAHLGLLDTLGQAWELAVAGERTPRTLQAQVALTVLHAAETAVEATSTAQRLCGASAAFLEHPATRALRDVEAGRQHLMFSRHHRPALARVAAGVDEVAPPFVT